MPYLQATQTDQVDLPTEGYWVRLKKRATYGDQLAAQSAMLKLDAANPGTVSQMEWSAYIQALTVSMTVEWNLTDENDAPLPITAENIAKLSAEDGQFLATEVTNRAKTRGVEQERPFALQHSTP
jgi:hypothetical protein